MIDFSTPFFKVKHARPTDEKKNVKINLKKLKTVSTVYIILYIITSSEVFFYCVCKSQIFLHTVFVCIEDDWFSLAN